MGMTEEFRIEEERPSGSNATVLVVYGEVDLHVAPELRERLDTAVDRHGPKVVVDLRRVSFLDSMALGVLLSALKQARASGGDLRLVVSGAKLRRLFEITLLDQVFTLASTREEALAPFSGTWGS